MVLVNIWNTSLFCACIIETLFINLKQMGNMAGELIQQKDERSTCETFKGLDVKLVKQI
jgi:hypothetical protein